MPMCEMKNKCQNINMADAALARREARRKRILENSHNRLQLISNITNDESYKGSESPNEKVRTPIIEPKNVVPAISNENTKIRGIVYNGVTNNEPVTHEPLPENSLQNVFLSDEELSSDSAAFTIPKPEASNTSFFEKFTTHKFDIVLLSVLIQLLHSFSITTADNTYFFLPLILYTTTKIFYFSRQESFMYADILLLLNGMNPQQTQKLISIFHWSSIVLQDVCIYLFATIWIQSFCIVINNIIS